MGRLPTGHMPETAAADRFNAVRQSRAVRACPGGIKPRQLRRETRLSDQQIQAAVEWNNTHGQHRVRQAAVPDCTAASRSAFENGMRTGRREWPVRVPLLQHPGSL
ncbi:hypothetical protein GCM10010431_84790 [Streptomyces kunmingensis]